MLAGPEERPSDPGQERRRAEMAAGGARRRDRKPADELGVALGAGFLGLLLVRGGDLAAAVGEPRSPLWPEGARPDDPGAGSGEHASAPPAQPMPVALAPGSILTTGTLIDAALLTRIAGELRFDATPIRMLNPDPPAPVAIAPVPSAGEGPQPVPAVAAPSFVSQVEPSAALPEEPGEDLGPIGEEIVGGEGDEVLVGGPLDDRIDGGPGNDTISGGGGDDVLAGGPGDDDVDGGPGHDRIEGGTGDDRLSGGAGNDRITGGPGDDVVDGGAGDDEVRGGSGDDTVTVGGPGDLLFEDPWGPAEGGRDTLVVAPDFGAQLEKAFPMLARGGVATFAVGDAILGPVPPGAPAFAWQVPPNVENVRLTGSEAHAIVGDEKPNRLEGNAGSNAIWGGAGDDRIRGGAGDDRLFGGPGDDLLLGEEGDDLLAGGPGDDLLYGGAGDDTYVLGLAEEGRDTIVDREGVNRIRLEGAEPARLSVRLEGPDLVLVYDGRELALVEGYRGRESAFADIEVGNRPFALSDFFGASAAPMDDLLAAFAQPGRSVAAALGDLSVASPPFADPRSAPGLPEIFPGADLWVEPTAGGSEGEPRLALHEGDRAEAATSAR
ncbi:MAG: hypothetical protein NZP72_07910 [Geminicoccaceae bacterium]|nr:hypothetical protein [Geminicoccaceae bacterium]